MSYKIKVPDFILYMSMIADERDYKQKIKFPDGIVIQNYENDRTLEIICKGSEIALYYFDKYPGNGPAYCSDHDLTDPSSIDWVMEWIDKLDED